jgi:ubiquinone/menaquinone biosynthesis C-methylase UbiE
LFLDNPVRRLLQNPSRIAGPYIREGQTVVDLGCGPGVFSLAMAEMVGQSGKVISVDIQDEMLQMVKQKAQKAGLQSRIVLHRAMPDALGLADKADFALAFYMVHEVPDRKRFLGEVKSILNPGGRFMIVEPKFHVSKAAFDETVAIAGSVGLYPALSPVSVLMSRAVLLETGLNSKDSGR